MKTSLLLTGATLVMLHAVAQAEDFEARTERPATGLFSIDTKVNDGFVTPGQIELFVQTMVDQEGNQPTGKDLDEAKRSARKELVTQEALAQAAVARGMDKDIEVVDALNYSKREILSRVFIEEFFHSNPVTDDQIRIAYDLSVKDGKVMEYKVRQILLPTREQAEAVASRIKKGESFVSLTKLTRDPGANANGGYVSGDGWFRPDIFVDATFAEAVEKQKLNVPSTEPFHTRFGWHLILVEEKRKVEKPEPFEQLANQVRDALRQKMAMRKLNELIHSVANKAKLTDAAGKPMKFDDLD